MVYCAISSFIIYIEWQKTKEMVSALFWNIQNKPITNIIATLAIERSVDILLLAESEIGATELLLSLNRQRDSFYHYAPGIGCKKIDVFTRFPSEHFQPQFETDRLTIRKLTLPGMIDVLIAITHFPSKIHWDNDSQTMECTRMIQNIRQAEELVGHNRTILVGDFNMNPFETGMISAAGLHGVMTRNIASQVRRTVQAEDYMYFYNPMWSLFGDASPGPPGTFYYRTAEHKVYFWNMFDQVLFRPDLLTSFRNEDLEIIDSYANQSLLRNGIPDTTMASDHLPLFFRFAV